MGVYRDSRAWTDEEWDATIDSLRSQGWLASAGEPALSDEGRRRREAIEQRTDELNLPAYEAIGQAGCDRIVDLAVPISRALADADLGPTSLRSEDQDAVTQITRCYRRITFETARRQRPARARGRRPGGRRACGC